MTVIKSIRQQVLLLFMGYAVGMGLLYLALTMIIAYVVEDHMIYSLLKIEASYVQEHHKATGQLPESRLSFGSIHPSSGLDVATELEQVLKNNFGKAIVEVAGDDNEIFTSDDDHYHYQLIQLEGGQQVYLIAEVSALLVVSKSPVLLQLFLAGFVITLLLAFLLAVKMTSKTVKPVLQLAGAVKEKQPLPSLQYELGYLSQTLTGAFEERAKALQRERDFSSDVSHELRTPLTVLSNTLTLAEQRPLTESDIQQLRHIDQQMQQTVDTLLALARQESLQEESIYLAPVLEQALMDCSLAANKELDLNMAVPEHLTINANSSLLTLLFTNLINNALYHGDSNQLSIDVDDGMLIFQNQSNKPMPANLFDSGVKDDDSPGIGQGLYLVARILEAMKMTYQIQQADGLFSVRISL